MRFAKRSSTRAGFLAVAFGVAAVVAVVGLATGMDVVGWIGLGAAVAIAATFATYLIVTERRRHEAAEEELTSEAQFLESIVESMAAIAGADDVLAETCVQAERLFEARARMLAPNERPRRAPAENAIVVPLTMRAEELGALRLTRERPFDRDDVVRATVLADFASREHENARLLAEAQVREAERSRLTDQLITAEQDERRRLANELHDGAVQSLSGIALLLDAGLNSIEEGRETEAREIIGRALERHRATIGQLRDLSFNLEPVVLREHGVAVDVDADVGERFAEKTQAALYQIIREAVNQAIRRGPPEHLAITVREVPDGGFETRISDDAPGERRRRTLDELAERARTLNGELLFEPGENGGTTVRVLLPPYASAG